MALFDGLMGNASQVNLTEVQREYAQILAPQEKIERAYKLIRDMFIFTDKRLILVDKQGLTGKKQNIIRSLTKASRIIPWRRQGILIWMRSYVSTFPAARFR